MVGVFTAFARAFGQLTDRAVLAVLAKSAGVTIAVFAVLGIAFSRAGAFVFENYATGWGEVGGLIGALLAVLGGWLLFRVVALAVVQFFADEVVLAVERRHYPAAAAAARKLPLAQEARNSLKGVLRAVAFNVAAAPFAILLLVTGIGTALVFLAVNAWLLGRELQDMVWLRHRAAPDVPPPLSGLTRLALGGIVAAMLLIPFVNLLAPVLGAAAATHLVHGRRARG